MAPASTQVASSLRPAADRGASSWVEEARMARWVRPRSNGRLVPFDLRNRPSVRAGTTMPANLPEAPNARALPLIGRIPVDFRTMPARHHCRASGQLRLLSFRPHCARAQGVNQDAKPDRMHESRSRSHPRTRLIPNASSSDCCREPRCRSRHRATCSVVCVVTYSVRCIAASYNHMPCQTTVIHRLAQY